MVAITPLSLPHFQTVEAEFLQLRVLFYHLKVLLVSFPLKPRFRNFVVLLH